MQKTTANSAYKISLTLQILLTRFQGQLLIPFADAVIVAGFKEQTARNQVSNDCFPLKTEKRGARRFIHIADLAAYIDLHQTVSSKPKRGRPPKDSKF